MAAATAVVIHSPVSMAWVNALVTWMMWPGPIRWAVVIASASVLALAAIGAGESGEPGGEAVGEHGADDGDSEGAGNLLDRFDDPGCHTGPGTDGGANYGVAGGDERETDPETEQATSRKEPLPVVGVGSGGREPGQTPSEAGHAGRHRDAGANDRNERASGGSWCRSSRRTVHQQHAGHDQATVSQQGQHDQRLGGVALADQEPERGDGRHGLEH